MRSRSTPGVVVLLLAALLGSCGGSAPTGTSATTALEALFPTLKAYEVTAFHRTDDCDYIVHARGAFQSETDCSVDVMGPSRRAAFDEVTRADFDAIVRESERRGGGLDHAYSTYGNDGSIVGGSYGFEWCRSYIYEPGWRELPPSDTEVYTAVNTDWYEESVCFF